MEKGVGSVEIGGYKIKEKGKLRAEKVKIYLTGEELAVVNLLQAKLGFATRPPLFRFLLHHYDDIEKASLIVSNYHMMLKARQNFEAIL
jgi:hypothetical protein